METIGLPLIIIDIEMSVEKSYWSVAVKVMLWVPLVIPEISNDELVLRIPSTSETQRYDKFPESSLA